MNPPAVRIVSHTGKALSVVHTAVDATSFGRRNDWMLLLAITPPILAAFAATEVGPWVIHEIGRQIRIHEKRPASPSLRGTPTPKELAADWREQPRTLAIRLRLGSRLADLDPTLDHSILRTTLPSGKTVIHSRKGGMKGWLEDRRVAIPYSTAMHYKKLAQRLRQILSLDDRIPLEWLVDGLPADQTLPAELAASFQTAHRRILAILHENRTFKALALHAEKQLGIVRLITVRRATSIRRQSSSKKRTSTDFSVISCGRRVTVAPERLEATQSAISHILRATNLSGTARHLRNRLERWLSALPPRPPN